MSTFELPMKRRRHTKGKSTGEHAPKPDRAEYETNGQPSWGANEDPAALKDDGTGEGRMPPPRLCDGNGLVAGEHYLKVAEANGMQVCRCGQDLVAAGRSLCDGCIIEEAKAGRFVPRTDPELAVAMMALIRDEIASRRTTSFEVSVDMGRRKTYVQSLLQSGGRRRKWKVAELQEVCAKMGLSLPWDAVT